MENTRKMEDFGNLLGSMLAFYGAMLAHLGSYVGPFWRLGWPILGLSSHMSSACRHILDIGYS